MNRRDFLKDSALATMSMAFAMGAEEIIAAPAGALQAEAPAGPPVTSAVIGLGPQGREILASLAKLNNAPVAAICDTYESPGYIKRATEIVPSATVYTDYRKVLALPAVQAVFVSTPSYLHKQIVIDALAAGKHVYCEAPLASSITEAHDIAVAANGAKTLFQSGLQTRSDKQHQHVLTFVKSDALGHICGARAQWHKKGSWKRAAPTPEREKELNWRLYKATSSGLPGEIGIHQFDVATWFLKAPPVSVTGFGGIMQWTSDGMEVPDTIQAVLEYPNGIRYVYDATLGDSFDGAYDLFMGSDSAVLLRDLRAWMFKETDSPLLGWEVYARKDKLAVGDEVTGTGIALVADATKLIKQGIQPASVGTDVTKTALFQAVGSFLDSIRQNKKPEVGAAEGLQATVVACKVHEACMNGSKINFENDWFQL